MVIGIATGLLGLGLALPTGLAFGYGYGYGVRQGYSAFKQPSKTAQGLKMSPDPVQGSLGMGLQTAEERTGVKTPVGPMTTGQSLQKADGVINSTNNVSQKWVTNKVGVRRLESEVKKDRETWRKFAKGVYPYNNKYYGKLSRGKLGYRN